MEIVGCGIIWHSLEIFFTINGQLMRKEKLPSDIKDGNLQLYPGISIFSRTH